MNEKWFEELKSQVNAFFETATEDEINQALKESGYEVYKDVDVPIIDLYERLALRDVIVTFEDSMIIGFTLSEQITIKNECIYFEEMGVQADNYGYLIAA